MSNLVAVDGIPAARLAEICRAEQEGRLLILSGSQQTNSKDTVMDRYVQLEMGKVYDHTNGDKYLCLCLAIIESSDYDARLERISDGWTLTAHGTRMDENGKICWNYSTGGHWPLR